ncbi:MAG: ATP-binding protein [Bacteroidota bacterium]
MKRIPAPGKTALLLLLLVLLPALFYSGYEMSSLTETEELTQRAYREQLEAILFSVNQHAWDLASSWAARVGTALAEAPEGSHREALLEELLRTIPPVRAIAVADSALGTVHVMRRTGTAHGSDPLELSLRAHAGGIPGILAQARTGYRRLEPLRGGVRGPGDTLMLAFALLSPTGSGIGAMELDIEAFIRTGLAPKLFEAAGEEFHIAVFAPRSASPILSTRPGTAAGPMQRKALWLFPGHTLGIRPAGTTLEELARGRFQRNLVLILLLDGVLLAGAWLVYRTIRRETELVRMKSDFVSNVSHELRTPLSLIRMYAETLEMDRLPDPSRRQEYYRTILQETERLSRLVNNILSFSRMEAGRKQYRFGAVSLNRVVDAVVGVFEAHLEQEGFALTVERDRNLPDVRADEEAVSEALINILDNAVKYSPRTKNIRIRTIREEGRAGIEVQDAGIGIPAEHRKKIFEKFYRVSGALVHDTKGSGLGLALVKHIMDAHGGMVEVESSPGEGSTFRLFFPL